MNEPDLNQLAQRVHKANEKWWQHPVTKERIERNKGELLMLVITELAEACEGERKDLMDDKLPHRKMAEVEMADAFIRLLDYAAGFSIELYMPERVTEYTNMPRNKGESLLCMCGCCVDAYTSPFYSPTEAISSLIYAIKTYCEIWNYDLMGAFEEKMVYNATRVDHTHEARQQADGKKW